MLSKFKTKWENLTPPPKDIHQILTGLQRYMLAKNPSTPMFLDKGETYFSEICGTYDTVYRDLHSKEIEEITTLNFYSHHMRT